MKKSLLQHRTQGLGHGKCSIILATHICYTKYCESCGIIGEVSRGNPAGPAKSQGWAVGIHISKGFSPGFIQPNAFIYWWETEAQASREIFPGQTVSWCWDPGPWLSMAKAEVKVPKGGPADPFSGATVLQARALGSNLALHSTQESLSPAVWHQS
jgi:hypothetical protein